MLRHEPAAADAALRVGFAGEDAGDEFHSGPDAARILPAAAGAAQPFAKNRAREDESALMLQQGAGERRGLAGGPHAYADERREQIGGNRESRAFRDVVDVADDFEAASGAGDVREQSGEALAGTFNARRHDAARDDGGFEQTEIVPGKIKNVGEMRDVRRGSEINARQTQHRFFENTEVGFDGRFG